MIFFSLKQFNLALFTFFIGLISGLILQIIELIFLKKLQKIPIKIIFDIVLYGFLSVFYIIFNNFTNFGVLAIIPILTFVLGISLIKQQTKKIVEFFETVWYNKINKILTLISKRLKLKKGKSKKDVFSKKS